MIKNMVLECRNGPTARGMKGDGRKEKQRDLANFTMKMEIITKDNSLTISFTERELISMRVEQNIVASGSRTYSLGLALISGRMGIAMKESLGPERSMGKESLSGTIRATM
jgi:hypothetical protein